MGNHAVLGILATLSTSTTELHLAGKRANRFGTKLVLDSRVHALHHDQPANMSGCMPEPPTAAGKRR